MDFGARYESLINFGNFHLLTP